MNGPSMWKERKVGGGGGMETQEGINCEIVESKVGTHLKFNENIICKQRTFYYP